MDLAALRAYLESLGNPLVLRGDDQRLGEGLAALVQTMAGKQISIDISGGAISVDGSTLTISGSSSDSWPVQGMSQAALTLTAATLTVTDADVANATLDAALPLAPGDSASVTVKPDQQSGVWDITLVSQPGTITPTELIALGITGPLPFDVPPDLNLLDQTVTVVPGSFVIRFAPNTTDDAYYAFTVSDAGATWHLITGVVDFAGLDLTAVITTRGWSVILVGHLVIASVKMDLGANISPAPIWTAFLRPSDGDTFPGVVELAQWIASGGDLGPQTSVGFSNLSLSPQQFDLALSGVSLSFSLAPAQVVSLQIKSQLTIVGLALNLLLTLPDLTIAGSLVSAAKVVDMLRASGIDPAGVPDTLTISAADFSAQATIGHYSVDVTVDGIWPSPPLKLDQITASVSYDQGAGFTGSFGAQIGVASTTIGLYAEYAGQQDGWVFTGSTDPSSPIPIGDLLTELANSFGITKVPAPITTLKLNQLTVSYKTGSGDFAFVCAAGFVVETTQVAVVVTIAVTPSTQAPAGPNAATTEGTKGYTATFTGQVTFDNLQFDIVFDIEDTGADVLIADYVHVGPDPVELQALVAEVSSDLARLIPAGISVELDEIKFVFFKQTSSQWAFGVRLGTHINLSELPIVGSRLPDDATLAVQNLQILYSNAGLDQDQTKIINPLLPTGVAKLPDTVSKDISFDADVQLGTVQKHLHAEITPPGQAQAAAASAEAAQPAASQALVPRAAAAAPVPASSTDPVKWLDVNKQFGIFSFQRVGVGYQDNVLEFALDASVALGPLAFSMQALTVGSPLTKFDPQFSLKGLALTFDRPPIAIGGAFLRVQETIDGTTYDSYYGELMVQVATFSLKALGGWSPDRSLFFIYVSIDVPLGGPPFLFVTGLAGGFGINSRLVLPTVDEVPGYELLPGVALPEQASPAETISAVIPSLKKRFQAQAGEYWVAAGIAFTSFEMIEAQAVVSVSFGVDLQIGVVGVCAMTFPTGDPYPVAYVEIDVVASFTPSTGLLAVDGKLSPASYLFGGFVQLTGGFAFYAWFSGDKRGDFVVSLGGYHPAFDAVAAGYPAVPRLGLAFSLGPVKVVGQAYFALTPSMFMAGIRLTATFEAGPIKAWFDAGVDFLFAWAPFHYEAHAWVTIGVSLDLGLFTISIQIGADLQIWGPAFGGQATVDLDIISFTIGFGAARALPPPIGWDTFAANFLPRPQPAAQGSAMSARAVAAADPAPQDTNILKATVTAGQTGSMPGVDWILDPDNFRILTASTIPANHALWATSASQTAELSPYVADYQRASAPAAAVAAVAAVAAPADMLLQLDHDTVTYSDSLVWAQTLNVGPIGETDVDSYLTITLSRRDENGNPTDYVTGVTVVPQLNASNTALWGPPSRAGDVDANAGRLIPATLTGFAISPVPRHPDQVSDVTLESLIFGEGHSTGFSYQDPAVDQSFTVTSTTSPDGDTFTIDVAGSHTASLRNEGHMLSALTDSWVAGQRSATLDELRRLGFSTLAGGDASLGIMASTALTDWPGAARIGSETWA